MKSPQPGALPDPEHVAPHAGAWIEISDIAVTSFTIAVAPHAGAWIEMPRD
ncbi:hypothetical protein HMPREF1141_1531 [Clostridium sp. MSTE9]|nr:hypothetical protein HMPREF1141_1531 [Clostridium sp. MSTE9]